MKRMFALALVILNLFVLSSAQLTSANTNAKMPAHMVKLSPLDMNMAAELNLDFTLVNNTGYHIKALYIGPSASKEWTEDMEILHGSTFGNGKALDITFSPRARAQRWDIMVEWADDYENTQWNNLKLTEISKVTLTYNRETDETHANIE
jgi:hypothetical protein